MSQFYCFSSFQVSESLFSSKFSVFLTSMILSIKVYFFPFYWKIMTAVRSHQRLPQLINELPPGCAKDLVLQLRGQTSKWVYMKFLNSWAKFYYCWCVFQSYAVACLSNMHPCNSLYYRLFLKFLQILYVQYAWILQDPYEERCGPCHHGSAGHTFIFLISWQFFL